MANAVVCHKIISPEGVPNVVGPFENVTACRNWIIHVLNMPENKCWRIKDFSIVPFININDYRKAQEKYSGNVLVACFDSSNLLCTHSKASFCAEDLCAK